MLPGIPVFAWRTLLVLALVSLSPAFTAAQQDDGAALEVTVTNEATGQPLPDVQVKVSGRSGVVFTDADGRARLSQIMAGNRVVEVSLVGYAMERVLVEFAPGSRVAADVALTSQPVEVEGLVVTSWGRSTTLRRTGFYDRQELGLGAFLSRDEIDRIRPIQALDLFRWMRGFMVVVDRAGNYRLVTTRGAGTFRECHPVVYLDGILTGSYTLDLLPPEQIAGIEGYVGLGGIPPQYNVTGSACGVVLIWTG